MYLLSLSFLNSLYFGPGNQTQGPAYALTLSNRYALPAIDFLQIQKLAFPLDIYWSFFSAQLDFYLIFMHNQYVDYTILTHITE